MRVPTDNKFCLVNCLVTSRAEQCPQCLRLVFVLYDFSAWATKVRSWYRPFQNSVGDEDLCKLSEICNQVNIFRSHMWTSSHKIVWSRSLAQAVVSSSQFEVGFARRSMGIQARRRLSPSKVPEQPELQQQIIWMQTLTRLQERCSLRFLVELGCAVPDLQASLFWSPRSPRQKTRLVGE